jgi:hypothetical protein
MWPEFIKKKEAPILKPNGYAMYKCRLCGVTFIGKEINQEDHNQRGYIKHNCGNGDLGVADYQGFKIGGSRK